MLVLHSAGHHGDNTAVAVETSVIKESQQSTGVCGGVRRKKVQRNCSDLLKELLQLVTLVDASTNVV